jgi:CubicO group peptidase (beta-lactamase class C family)
MLLSHTSGLQNYPNASIELEPQPTQKVKNVIQLALAAEVSALPGKVSSYNNKAEALLAGITGKASGLQMDKFFEKYF